MSVIDTILNRHSYRGRYTDEKVSRHDLRVIMEAGLAAPSGCNKQTTSLIGVDDKKILEKIISVIDPPVAETTPAMICVLTQRINAYRDKCFAIQDYSAAIENMLLAIEELGYKSCWYEGHITDDDRICDRIADILNVPKDYELVCILPVGRAVSDINVPVKKEFNERAWFNGFNTNETEYRVNFQSIGGFGFTSKKVVYAVGEHVEVIFNAIMTDTSYTFHVNVDDFKVTNTGSTVHISFIMPDHDVDVSYTSKNVMMYEPNTFSNSMNPAPIDQNDKDSWICPACGAKNTAKFCFECGTPRPKIDGE